GDVRRLPRQSVRHPGGVIPARDRRDNDQRGLLAEYRRVDADPRVHPTARDRQPVVTAPFLHDGPRSTELPRAAALVDPSAILGRSRGGPSGARGRARPGTVPDIGTSEGEVGRPLEGRREEGGGTDGKEGQSAPRAGDVVASQPV